MSIPQEDLNIHEFDEVITPEDQVALDQLQEEDEQEIQDLQNLGLEIGQNDAVENIINQDSPYNDDSFNDDGSEQSIGWTEDNVDDLEGDIDQIDTVCATTMPRRTFHIRLIQSRQTIGNVVKYIFNSMLFIGIKQNEPSTTRTFRRDTVPEEILLGSSIKRSDLGDNVWVIKEYLDSDDTIGFIRFRIASVLNLPSAYIAMWAADNDGIYSLLGTKYYYNLQINAIQERIERPERPLTSLENENLILYLDELKQKSLALRKKTVSKGRTKKSEKSFEDTIETYKQVIYDPDPFEAIIRHGIKDGMPVPDPYFMTNHIARGEIWLIKEDSFILEDYNVSTTTINAASIIDFTRWVTSLPEYQPIHEPSLTGTIKEILASHMIKYWPNYCRTPPGSDINTAVVCKEGGDQSYSVQPNRPDTIGPVYTILKLDFTNMSNQKQIDLQIKAVAATEKKIYDEKLELLSAEMRYAKDLIWRPDISQINLDSCSITETVIHVNYRTGTTSMAAASTASEVGASITHLTSPDEGLENTIQEGIDATAAQKAASSSSYMNRMVLTAGLPGRPITSRPARTRRYTSKALRPRAKGLGATDFVDLLKIFDNFPLSKETPFIKFRGDESNEGFHKVDRSITENVSSDELIRWISNKTKTKTPDGIKYTLFGKGLALKTEIYRSKGKTTTDTTATTSKGTKDIKDKDLGEAKYATIFITRDGKIEIKASWEEDEHADLTNVVEMLEACRRTIETINTIDYHLPRTNRNRFIGLPNPEFYRMSSNTKIVLINAISQFTTPSPIDFDELNELARNFHKSFANVMANDIGFVGIGATRRPVTQYSPLLKLRYNRISNFQNMGTIEKFFYDMAQELSKKQVNDFYDKGVGREAMAKLAHEHFAQRGENVTLQNIEKYLPEKENLVRSNVKHPGVDLKIRPTTKLNTYKIYILGAKGVNQMRRIHFYATRLISLYFFTKTQPQSLKNLDFYWKRLNTTGAKDNIASIENVNAEIIDDEEQQRKEKNDAKAFLKNALESGELGNAVLSDDGSESGEFEFDEDDLLNFTAQFGPKDQSLMFEVLPDLEDDGVTQADEENQEEFERQEAQAELAASAAAKARAKKRTSQPMSKGAFIEAYDPELVPKGSNGYSRKCQPVGRQPIVLSDKEYDDMIQRLNNESAAMAASDPIGSKEKLASVDIVTGQKRVISYRGNRYMCPLGFCHTDHEPLSTQAQINKHKEMGHFVSVQESDKPIPGFIKGKTSDGLCMPCCFNRSGPAWQKSIAECLVGQGKASGGIGTSDTSGSQERPENPVAGINAAAISDDQFRYILKAKEKQIIIPEGGRLGHLPQYLSNLLNVDKNCDTSNTANSAADGFDCYVRMGMPSNSINKPNTFLNAIGNQVEDGNLRYGISGAELRERLVNTLRNDPDIFEGLMEGSLKIIFTERPSDSTLISTSDNKKDINEDPEENFISYLENQPINETMLWDFVTKPGVVVESGFNLFILEARAEKNKGIGEYIFICPNGFEMSKIYDPNRQSLVLFKFRNHYEPIYRADVKNRNIEIFKRFSNNHPFVKTLVELLKTCKPYDDKKAEVELSKYYSRIKERQIKFKPSQSAEQIYELINETPHDFTVVESYDLETEEDTDTDLDQDLESTPTSTIATPTATATAIATPNDNDNKVASSNAPISAGTPSSVKTTLNRPRALPTPIRSRLPVAQNSQNSKESQQKSEQIGGMKQTTSSKTSTNANTTSENKEKTPSMDTEVIGQIVDDYNKTIYLILKNGLKFPVDPSQKVNRLTEYQYEELPELDYVTAVKTLLDLYNFYQVRGHILQNVVGADGNTVHGILLDTGLMVPVKPVSKNELNEIGTITSDRDPNLAISQKDLEDTVNFMTMESVDRMIRSGQINENETRVMSNARRFYEAETYQRIRFELSKWLNSDKLFRKELTKILASTEPVVVKRRMAYDWLYDVITDMSTSSGRQGDKYLDGYHTPNVRRVCLGMTNCGSDPHCQYVPEDNMCKLFVPKINLVNGKPNIPYYSHLLADELVRNNFKRAEILDDRIDNYISRIARTIRPNEVLFSDADPEVTLASINELYTKGIDWDRKRKEFYTNKNPQSYNIKVSGDDNLDLSLTSKEGEELSDPIVQEGAKPEIRMEPIDEYFSNLLEPMTGFRQIVWEGTEDLIFEHIARAINQKSELLGEEPKETALSIKKHIVNFLKNGMNPEILSNGTIGRDGWKLYLDNMKEKYPAEFDKIYNLDEVVTNDDEPNPTISLSTEISSKAHKLNEHDLSMISRLFGVKFITLRHQLLHKEDKNSKRILCLSTTQTLEPWTIMLYWVGQDKYRVIINTSQTPGDSATRYQYIWNQEIPELALPYNFYNHVYLPQCGRSDQKKKIDPANTTLILEDQQRRKLGLPRMKLPIPAGNTVTRTSPRRKRLLPPVGGLVPRARTPISTTAATTAATTSDTSDTSDTLSEAATSKDLPVPPVVAIPTSTQASEISEGSEVSAPEITTIKKARPPIMVPRKILPRTTAAEPIISQQFAEAIAFPTRAQQESETGNAVPAVATGRVFRVPFKKFVPTTATSIPTTPGSTSTRPGSPGVSSTPRPIMAPGSPRSPRSPIVSSTPRPIMVPGSPRSPRSPRSLITTPNSAPAGRPRLTAILPPRIRTPKK